MVNHPNRKRTTSDPSAPKKTVVAPHNHDRDYEKMRYSIEQSFALSLEGHNNIFRTNASGLWDSYLDLMPEEFRQVHNCHTCRRFIEDFGGLVGITPDGNTVPVMWDPKRVPDFYVNTMNGLFQKVRRAHVTGVFATKNAALGIAKTGPWTHFVVYMSSRLLCKSSFPAHQVEAAHAQNLETVARALAEYKADVIDQAIRLFEMDTLSSSEKFVAPMRWLRGLHDRPRGQMGHNLLWRAVASAPEGYCHVKSSVIGPLLDAIKDGEPFDTIKARFNAMLDPIKYQRPKAAPTAGNIAQAEKLIKERGLEKSLERRFARLDEIKTAWVPTPPRNTGATPNKGGVFSHLLPKDDSSVQPVELAAQTMTWARFSKHILPMAERLEFYAPARGNYSGMLTALHDDAPPLMKWDNQFSTYVYNGYSEARQWKVKPYLWTTVNAVSLKPSLWDNPEATFLGDSVLIVLEGAVDTRTDSGNAIFPVNLRGDLHSIRSTIEAYSKTAPIHGRDSASACGYAISKGHCSIKLRVWSHGAWSVFNIDRWE